MKPIYVFGSLDLAPWVAGHIHRIGLRDGQAGDSSYYRNKEACNLQRRVIILGTYESNITLIAICLLQP